MRITLCGKINGISWRLPVPDFQWEMEAVESGRGRQVSVGLSHKGKGLQLYGGGGVDRRTGGNKQRVRQKTGAPNRIGCARQALNLKEL